MSSADYSHTTQPQAAAAAAGGYHGQEMSHTAGASVHGMLRGPETTSDTLVSTQRVGTVRVTVQEHEYMGKLEQDLTYLAEKESRTMSKIDRLRMHRTEVMRYNMKEKLLEAFEAELDKRDREQMSTGHGGGLPTTAVAVAHRVVTIEQWKSVLRKICHDAVDTKAVFEWENHVKADLAAAPLELAESKKWKQDPRHNPIKLKAVYLEKAETRKADLWKERARQVASLHGKFGGDFYRFANSFFDLLGADAGGGADDPFGGVVNRFGFVNPAPEPMEEQRVEFGKGPLDKGSRGVRTGKQWLLAPHQVPLRIKYTMGTQYCLTCVQPPSAFDSRRVMARSGTKPKIGLQLEHVHNFCARRNGKHLGQNLHFCRPVEQMDTKTLDGVAVPYTGSVTPMVAFYSAGVGVVMDLTKGEGLRQRFFRHHTNDITCLAVHPNGVFIATGQEDPPDTEGASGPFVCIWHVTMSEDGPRDGTYQVAEVGIVPVDDDDDEEGDRAFVSAEGLLASETRTARERRVGGMPEFKCFYKRAIGALEFSHDGEYLVASGEDDNHTIGVWKWETGQLVGTKGGIKGTAPEIFDITWGRAHTTRKDCKCHFVTHGPSHLNFWKFDDSQRDPKKALSFQAAKITAPHPQPQLTTCVTWTNAGNVVTGGSNGCIYVWNPNNAKLLHSFDAHPLPRGVRECVARPQKEGGHTGVLSLAYKPPTDTGGKAYLLSGGRDGKVKVWPTKDVKADPVQHGEIKFSGKAGGNGKGGKSRKANRRCEAVETHDAIAETDIDDGRHVAKGGPAAVKQFKLGRGSTGSAGVRSVFETRLIEDSTTYAPREGISAIAVDHLNRAVIGTDFSQLQFMDDVTKKNKLTSVLNGHFRRTCALAAWSPKDQVSRAGFYITGGDEGLVCKWSVGNMAHRDSGDSSTKVAPAMVCSKVLRQRREHGVMDYEAKRRLKCRGIGISTSGKLAAVGCADGSIVMLSIPEGDAGEKKNFDILAVKNLPDANSAIDVLRFSPDDKMLAIGSHDNYVEIFDLPNEDEQAGGKYRIKKRHRCKGHSSFITGLDWSSDSCVIQSNCAGREILYWDAATGQQKRSTLDSVESDTDWASWTCQLGFPVMGIWGDGFASNDINAVHRSRNKRFLVTSTDYGDVRLFNAPCVLEDAPFRKAWGHASHVMHVRFIEGNDQDGRDDKRSMRVASVGGADAAVFQWKIDFNPDAPDGRGGFNPALLDEWDGSGDEGDSGDDEAEQQAARDAEREEAERLARERKAREAADLKRKKELEEQQRRQAELDLQKRVAASQSTSALNPDKKQVLVVKIVQAEDLAKADKDFFTRKPQDSDPFCEVLWCGDYYGKTDKRNNDSNPKWGEEKDTFRFHLPPKDVNKGVELNIVVYDKDFIGKDFMGQVTLTHDETQHDPSGDGKSEQVPSLYSFGESEKTVKLHLQKRADGLERKQKFVQGTITLQFSVEEHANGSDIKGLSTKQEADEIDAVAMQNDRPVMAAQHLHVHVRDAVDLRAADAEITLRGFKATSSDPFATLMWNGAKLKNGQTKHIAKTLNPKWDEFFQIPTEKLVLKVMDKDTLSKDDFMGMVQIDGQQLLGPEEGGSLKPYKSPDDPEPQPYDLTVLKGSKDRSDVQTEGGGAKLWAQIATVDTLLITIKACAGLVAADFALLKKNKSSDPRVKIFWSQKSPDPEAAQKYELMLDTWEPKNRWDWDPGRDSTSYEERWKQYGTLNPLWDASCCVDIVVREEDLAGASLKFEVWDHDTGNPDDFLGQKVVPGDKLLSYVDAENPTEKLEKGSGEVPDVPKKRWADALKNTDDLGSISFSVERSKRLRIQCTKATNLKSADTIGKSDPYVKVLWNDSVVGKTKEISKELEPVWTEEHGNIFFVPRQELMVQLWDRDKGITEGVVNDYLGHATLISDHIGRFTEAQCYKRHMLCSRPGDLKDKKPAQGKIGLALFPMSKLRVQIRRCTNLEKSDPTCKVFWTVAAQPGDDIARKEARVGETNTKRLGSTKGKKNPLWHNEFFEMHLPKDLTRAKMLIEVWSGSAFLGQIELGAEELHKISSMSVVERKAQQYELKPAPGAKGPKGKKQDKVGGWIGLSFSIDHGTMPHREMLYPVLDTATTGSGAQDEDESKEATVSLPAQCDLRRVQPDARIKAMTEEEQEGQTIFLQVPLILDAIGCPKANMDTESDWRDKLTASMETWLALEGPKDEIAGEARKKPTAWSAEESYKLHFSDNSKEPKDWLALSAPIGARHGLRLQVLGAQGLAKTDGSTKPICKVFFDGGPNNPDNEKCKMKTKGVPGTENVVWGGSSLDEGKEPTWQGEGATPPTLQLPHMAIRVEVWDHDKAGFLTLGDKEAKGYDTSKDFLGQVTVEGEQLRKAVEHGETLSKLPMQRDWTRASKELESDHTHANGNQPTITLKFDCDTKLRVDVLDAKDLPNCDSRLGRKLGKPDPWVEVYWGPADADANDKDGTVKLQTDHIEDTNNPAWDRKNSADIPWKISDGQLPEEEKNHVLRLEVWDKDGGLMGGKKKAHLLGEHVLDIEMLEKLMSEAEEAQKAGKEMPIQEEALGEPNGVRPSVKKGSKDYLKFVEAAKKQNSKIRFRVSKQETTRVHCVSAEGLAGADKDGTSQPFCKVFFNDAFVDKTKAVGSKREDWDVVDKKGKSKEIMFGDDAVVPLPRQKIRVEVWDDNFVSDTILGQVTIESDNLGSFLSKDNQGILPLKRPKGKDEVQGSLELALCRTDILYVHTATAVELHKKAKAPCCHVLWDGNKVLPLGETKKSSDGRKMKELTTVPWGDPKDELKEGTWQPAQLFRVPVAADGEDHRLEFKVWSAGSLIASRECLGGAQFNLGDILALNLPRSFDDRKPHDGYDLHRLGCVPGVSKKQDLMQGWLGLRMAIDYAGRTENEGGGEAEQAAAAARKD